MTPGQAWIGIATIIAVVLGPILAIQVDRRLQRMRDKKMRKMDIFRKLMMTRAAPVAINHIDALNLIEAEYDSRKASDKAVLDRWREHWDHLNTKQGLSEGERTAWEKTRAELLAGLLLAMSDYLKLGIDRSILKRASYYPEYYGNAETEGIALRKAAIAVFEGKQGLKVEVSEVGETRSTIVPYSPVRRE